jgi:hypothetical protein
MAPPWIAEKASARRQNSAKPGAWRAESALSAGQVVACVGHIDRRAQSRARCFGVVGPTRAKGDRLTYAIRIIGDSAGDSGRWIATGGGGPSGGGALTLAGPSPGTLLHRSNIAR